MTKSKSKKASINNWNLSTKDLDKTCLSLTYLVPVRQRLLMIVAVGLTPVISTSLYLFNTMLVQASVSKQINLIENAQL